jgi:hypothetical protein
MSDSLRAEVVPPRRKTTWLLLLAPLVAQLAVMSTCEQTETKTVFVPPPLPTVKPPPARVISSELHLVFRDTDTTYMQIEKESDARIGDKFYVDNDCIASVVGYETVMRAASDWDKISNEERVPVLSAVLDRCDGTYARSATLPMVVVPERRPDDAALVKIAKRMLFSSPAAAETARSWRDDYDNNDDWKTQALYDIRTLYHPLTKQTWISVHAYNETGCGEAPINIWGLFRVDDGALQMVEMRDLGEMTKIDQIIDIEGDGTLELIGRPWLGLDVMVTRASGEQLELLPLPYVGCPC